MRISKLIFCVLIIIISHSANSQLYSGSASNRFHVGAKMVEKDIEFISANSTTIFKVRYNLYVHEDLAKKIRMEDFTTDFIQAKIRLSNQGKKICGRNIDADECTVYYWTDLSDIPALTEHSSTYAKLDLAPGVYKKLKRKHGKFNWLGEDRVLESREPNGAVYEE